MPIKLQPEETPLSPDFPLVVRALLYGRFDLDRVERGSGYAMFVASRPDEFGVARRYYFAVFKSDFSSSQV